MPEIQKREELQPAGSSGNVKFSLEAEVKKGTFREDLYYRISVYTIQIPPLRDRKEDIPDLTRKYLDAIHQEAGCPHPPAVEEDAWQKLLSHDWPGNIRELQSVLTTAIVGLGGASMIEARDIHLRGATDANAPAASGLPPIVRELLAAKGSKKHVAPTPEQKQCLYQECRVGLGWSQVKIAQELQVDKSLVSKWFKEIKNN